MSLPIALLRARTALVCLNCRSISTSTPCNGKRNFRKFPLNNKRGSKEFREKRNQGLFPDLPIDPLGVRPTGYKLGERYHIVPEMIPEIVVPDLTGFQLKPYVSYRVPDVVQSEFTSQDLFDAVYSNKIVKDFKEGKLDENGEPLEPSSDEKLSPEEAFKQARKTGSDLFVTIKPE